jgi:hypothetical protein
MIRSSIIAIALIFTVAACSPAPDSALDKSPSSSKLTVNQETEQSDITVDAILRDIVGRVVTITAAAGDGPSTDWTFDADEFKQVDILNREITPTDAAIIVFMTTFDNPKPNEHTVQVSGKLRLRYERQDDKWLLQNIENLTFRYSVGDSV